MTHIAAVITLQDGCHVDGLRTLIEEECEHLQLSLHEGACHAADCMTDILASVDGVRLPGLGPDLIGEAVVIRMLVRHASDVQQGIVERALHRDPSPVSEMLRRIQRDHLRDDPSRLAFEWAQHVIG